MALAECRRFALLPEALVARSALEAAGLHPIVFDTWRASVAWTEQFTLNGIRVMVPEQELEVARQILATADPPTPAGPQPSGPPSLSLYGYLIACLAIGWPLAGFRRPTRFHRTSALVLTLVTGLIVVFSAWLRWRAESD